MKLPKRLIPVKFRMKYSRNKVNPYYLDKRFFVERNDGKPLTYPIPFAWAHLIATQINRSFSAQTTAKHGEVILLGTLRIEGNPVEEKRAPIVAPDRDGILVLGESPEYTESIICAREQGEELFLNRVTNLPIEGKVIVSCEFHINSRKKYTLPLSQAWVLDVLHRLKIIRSKTSDQVISMDGSKIFRDCRGRKPPHIIVTIWGVGKEFDLFTPRKKRGKRTTRKLIVKGERK